MTLDDMRQFCGGPGDPESIRDVFSDGEYTYAIDQVVAVRIKGAPESVPRTGPTDSMRRLFAAAVLEKAGDGYAPPAAPDETGDVQIGGNWFDVERVRKLAALPGCRFFPSPYWGCPCYVTFDRGEGLIMPKRHTTGG